MSFFPIPLNKNYTGQKKLKTASDERLPKPKSHTIKNVRENYKILSVELRNKIKRVIECMERFQIDYPNITPTNEEFCSYLSVQCVFSSSFEAKCFITAFKEKIIEEWNSNKNAGSKKETNYMEL